MEEVVEQFVEALRQGQQDELAKRGFASLAKLVTMFYDGLKGSGLPEPLVYILTCNFAAQAMAGGMGGADPGAKLPSED